MTIMGLEGEKKKKQKKNKSVGMWERCCLNLISSLLDPHIRKSFYFYQTKLFIIYYLYSCADQISTQFLKGQVHLGVALMSNLLEGWAMILICFDTEVKLALIYLPLSVVNMYISLKESWSLSAVQNKAECMHILVLRLLQSRICTLICSLMFNL